MRSPLVALFIGCAALLSPRATLASRVPVFVYRPPPTATPTSSPSSSLQPSLRPSSPPVTISASALEITTSSSESTVPQSPYGFVWVAPVVLILLACVGVMYKLDKKQKLKKKTTPNAEASAEGATATEGNEDGGLTGWLSSLWPNNQFWPTEEPETNNEANKDAKKDAGKMTLTV
eukprot:CAMPEP_0201686784 /NCGR_PEP_ID=MMETSP0578-20130828/1102_1 /ASSEMBLY_ACC=CAM_ASM_000663 /TAXON_ID=267565 /ORGANISM="Skeletonema grethea, Strain CCMP 1804" /LENGTH=175 /DNA_ID=CAMNT_0048170881 /DNA_START=40 /DNA_END=567 /DNA_ORIENTATION=+